MYSGKIIAPLLDDKQESPEDEKKSTLPGHPTMTQLTSGLASLVASHKGAPAQKQLVSEIIQTKVK